MAYSFAIADDLLLGSHTYSVRTFCFGHHVCLLSVCLSRVRSRKLCKIYGKFCHHYKKSRSEGKNITSYFALEVAK